MAYSSVTYTGDGSTRVYSIPFPFLSRDYIHVFLRRKDEAEAFEIGSHELEWLTEATLRLPQPAPASGDIITIRRITDREKTFVDFRDGSVLSEEDLDAQSQQLLHICQEAFDALSTEAAQGAVEEAWRILDKCKEILARLEDAHIDAISDIKCLLRQAEDCAARSCACADRAEDALDQMGNLVIMGSSAYNLEASWLAEKDYTVGDILTLPDGIVYFPGRNVLFLGSEGTVWYNGMQYDEQVCEEGEKLVSNTVTLRMDVPKGTPLHVWVVASNVSQHAEDIYKKLLIIQQDVQANSDRAAECADVSCECATQSKHYSEEARRHAQTASNAAAEATEQADRAEQAADDAEAAAIYADRVNRRFGIFTVKHEDKLSLAPNGFYIIWEGLPVCCTDSLPLKPHDCTSGEDIPMDEGFYLCVPGPTKPTDPDEPGGGGGDGGDGDGGGDIPGGGSSDVTICGARKSLIAVTPKPKP